MSDFRNGATYQALMVSLGRIEDVNRVAFEAAQASERKPLGHHDRRRLEKENKMLGRQLRSALLSSAYSLAEAVIIGLAPKTTEEYKVLKPKIQRYYDLSDNPSALHLPQYQLQSVMGLCKGKKWDYNWSDLHQLRKMRNKLLHDGGIGEQEELSKRIDRKEGFRAWIEPMFEGSDAPVYVLVIGEMHFRDWLQRLRRFIMDIDAELSKSVTKT